jgi:hypothetical protein
MLLEPDEDRTCLTGQIYLMEIGYVQPDPTATVLEPDRGLDMSSWSDISDLHRIYPTDQMYPTLGQVPVSLHPSRNGYILPSQT